MNFFAKLLWSGAAQSAKYNGVKALLMSADHYLFSTKFANCNSHLFANLVLLLFWKFWIQLLLDPAFIFVLISLWSNPFKVCFPNFFTAAVKVEVFSTRLKASPEFVNCGGEKFCTRHFLLWQGDVKWPLRSASALTWYHTSYGRLPQKLPFFLCPFFTQSSWPCHSSLLSNQARHKDLDSWWWWGWWWHWSWWYFIGPCPVKYHPADIAYCIIAGQCYIDPSQGSKGSFSVQCGSARAYLIRLGKSHHVPAVHLIIFPYTATNLKNPHQNFLRNESINRSNFFSLRDIAVSSENVRIT